ncbi:hypothetical protein [Planctomyces sp. SH-PL62]|uniref:hypothetical protein n=1 Tax=Planctomyces sp. SH-PL62 TaxID=1636152 RepID=UPI0008386DA7|nr:hypothetical protein [Planctomyces sp. SH-PL62]
MLVEIFDDDAVDPLGEHPLADAGIGVGEGRLDVVEAGGRHVARLELEVEPLEPVSEPTGDGAIVRHGLRTVTFQAVTPYVPGGRRPEEEVPDDRVARAKVALTSLLQGGDRLGQSFGLLGDAVSPRPVPSPLQLSQDVGVWTGRLLRLDLGSV